MQDLQRFGFDPADKDVADFGCGVGRITQNLAKVSGSATGIDISRPMIEKARELSKIDNCKYLLNQTNDLSQIASDSFDLVFSALVLQHNRPHIAKDFIHEFFRITRPGGIVHFQLPCDVKGNLRGTVVNSLPGFIKYGLRVAKHRTLSPFEMHWVAQSEILEIAEQAGFEHLRSQEDPNMPGSYVNCTYTFKRPQSSSY